MYIPTRILRRCSLALLVAAGMLGARSAHAASSSAVQSQPGSAGGAPGSIIFYPPPTGTGVRPAANVGASCFGNTLDANVSGTTVIDQAYQNCTGIGATQSMKLTMQHCDPWLWTCLFTNHPEYGQPNKTINSPGGWYFTGAWSVPHSSNGYLVECDHYAIFADGAQAEGLTDSQKFMV